MTITTSYLCEVCGKDVSDSALAADTTLRRIVLSGMLVTREGDSAPETSAAGGFVFCGLPDMSSWSLEQTQDVFDVVQSFPVDPDTA